VAKKKASANKVWLWIKRIFFFLFISHLLYVVALKWINPPFTITQFNSSINCLTEKELEFNRDYIGYDQMGKNAKLAVLAAEDQLFPEHHGFDFDAIQKAIEYNQKNQNGKLRGASTISQQVAKNVFLWQGRNFIRKGLEVYFTFLIELIWGKKRILEMYLNVAEMGNGIFGIEAAAQHYFHKTASALTASEAAWIACILPSPRTYSVHAPTHKLEKKHHRVQQYMKSLNHDELIQSLIK
jgi:monofunctional biosynthetic peptidoglycan transglycosylase